MSFASEIKNELCQDAVGSRELAAAECYGILLYCSLFSPSELRILTSNAKFGLRLPRLFHRAFGLDFDRQPDAPVDGKKSGFAITDPEKLARILAVYGAEPDTMVSHHINLAVLEEDAARVAFIRGAFLAGGSATDPEKSFHLELASPHHSVARETISLLLELGLAPKESARRGNTLIYFKQADLISDFLTIIGASNAAMQILTAKVDREMNNTVTRQINCDSANADKIVSASAPQLEAIRRIMAGPGLDFLPEALQDTALLRFANPEASLADLATLSSPPVTKSCLAYRLKKIAALAAELDKEELS